MEHAALSSMNNSAATNNVLQAKQNPGWYSVTKILLTATIAGTLGTTPIQTWAKTVLECKEEFLACESECSEGYNNCMYLDGSGCVSIRIAEEETCELDFMYCDDTEGKCGKKRDKCHKAAENKYNVCAEGCANTLSMCDLRCTNTADNCVTCAVSLDDCNS